MLRFAENPRDRVAGFRVLQLLPGIGPSTAAQVLDAMAGVARRGDGARHASGRRSARADDWPALRRRCSATCDAKSAAWPAELEQVRLWYEPHLERIHEDATMRRADLAAARADRRRLSLARALPDRADARSAGRHQRPGRPAASRRGLSDPLDHPFGQGPGMEDRCSCSTWSTAASRPTSAPARSDEIEEERRLLYVAMTRAKDALHLVMPQRFYTHGQAARGDRHVYASRTRFIPASILGSFEVCALASFHAADAPPPRSRRCASTSARACAACGASQPALAIRGSRLDTGKPGSSLGVFLLRRAADERRRDGDGIAAGEGQLQSFLQLLFQCRAVLGASLRAPGMPAARRGLLVFHRCSDLLATAVKPGWRRKGSGSAHQAPFPIWERCGWEQCGADRVLPACRLCRIHQRQGPLQ